MKKFIALLLCLVIVLSFPASATASELFSLQADGSSVEKTEILSKRDAYSKTYLLPDGSYQYVAYAEPVHYKDSNDTYVEIDNKITESVTKDGYKYTNASNSWNAYFAEKLSNSDAVMMTDGQHSISFCFPGQTGTEIVTRSTDIAKDKDLGYYSKLAADNRSVIYTDVVADVDIAYTVQAGLLKEDIILKSKDAPTSFKFRLNTGGLTIKTNNNTISLFDSNGKEIFSFAPLYMEDANGKRSDNVTMEYTSVKNGYEVTITADRSFLEAEDTAYPVVIDPSVMVTGSDVTFDTCVDEQYPTSNYYLSENLWTGGALGTNAMRTYIKFALPSDVYASQVTSAYIYLLKKDYQTPTIQAYRVASDWTPSAMTWNTRSYYSTESSSPTAVNTVGNWYGLDITSILTSWLAGTYPNYGVVLKEPSETNSSQKTKFYSSDAPSPNKPELVINYSGTNNVAQLIGVDATGHDHHSSLLSAQPSLEYIGYTVPSVHTGSFSNQQIKTYLDDNTNSLFISRSHGGYQAISGVQINTYIQIADNAFFFSNIDLTSLNLSNMDLVMFIACKTARGGKNGDNLPHQAVSQGAIAAIGFEENIYCADANAWLIQFARLMELHYSIASACTLLRTQGAFIGTGLDTVVVCGNENIILY